MRNIRLFWRLFSSYLWITVVALVFVAWSGSSVLRDFYLDQVARELENGAYLCRPEVASLLASDDMEAMDRLCKSLGKATQTRITVILPSGKVVGDTEEDPRRMDNHRDRPEVAEALAGGVGRVTRTSDTVREELLYVAVGLERRDAIPAVVRLAVPLTEVNRTLRSVRMHFFVVGAGGRIRRRGEPLGLPPHQPPAGAPRNGRAASGGRRARSSPRNLRHRGNRRPGRRHEPDGRTMGRSRPNHPPPAKRAGGHAVEHGRGRPGGGQRGHGHHAQRELRRAGRSRGGQGQRPQGPRGDSQAGSAPVRRIVAVEPFAGRRRP